MKKFGMKCVLGLAVMAIALGAAVMVSGCKKKEAPPAPPTQESVEKAVEENME